MQCRFGTQVHVYTCPAGHMTYWQEDPVGEDYLLPCEVCGASWDRRGEGRKRSGFGTGKLCRSLIPANLLPPLECRTMMRILATRKLILSKILLS